VAVFRLMTRSTFTDRWTGGLLAFHHENPPHVHTRLAVASPKLVPRASDGLQQRNRGTHKTAGIDCCAAGPICSRRPLKNVSPCTQRPSA
jgi:hypothetical protein